MPRNGRVFRNPKRSITKAWQPTAGAVSGFCGEERGRLGVLQASLRQPNLVFAPVPKGHGEIRGRFRKKLLLRRLEPTRRDGEAEGTAKVLCHKVRAVSTFLFILGKYTTVTSRSPLKTRRNFFSCFNSFLMSNSHTGRTTDQMFRIIFRTFVNILGKYHQAD